VEYGGISREEEDSMSDNLELGRRFVEEIINKGNLDVIDEITVPNLNDHDLPPGVPPTVEGIKGFFRQFRAAFPDAHYEIDVNFESGDLVCQVLTGSGTMTGEMSGMPPTGKHATWREVHVIRIENGKATEHWGAVDQMGMMVQLGVIPAPAGATTG
jgi:predicted ester cyclase